MEKGLSFYGLTQKMNQEELNEFCKKASEEYANSDVELARAHFCKKYNLTKSCFAKVKSYAIENGLVGEDVIAKMTAKAEKNRRINS